MKQFWSTDDMLLFTSGVLEAEEKFGYSKQFALAGTNKQPPAPI
jgi:hypothetical protein